jgi:alpha-glucoside transport system permease protein
VIKVLNTLIAIVAGVGGALVVYWLLNFIAERLPGKWEDRVKPYLYILPAIAALGIYLVYPVVQTTVYSFANATSSQWVGFKNYSDLFQQKDFQITLVNTLLWILIVPVMVVILGLAVATLADRLGSRGERTAKTIIFLPMAVSGVALAAIWRFVYEVRPAGEPQVGILNGIVTALGHDPVAWLQLSTAKVNTLLLMVVLIWAQVGFSMVLLSAAIKGVPEDTLEAARIDGANEAQVFFRVVVPQIWGTVITVFVTTVINVMKVFDVVYVMTGGNFNTNVIAVRFFNEIITNGNAGRAAAIVVVLVIAVIPLMIYQVRHFRAEEAAR